MRFLDEVASGPNRAHNLKATSPKINCAAILSAQQDVKTSAEKLYIFDADSDYLIGCSAVEGQSVFKNHVANGFASKGLSNTGFSHLFANWTVAYGTWIWMGYGWMGWTLMDSPKPLRSKKWGLGCGGTGRSCELCKVSWGWERRKPNVWQT